MGADARAGLLGTPSPGPHATALATCRGLATLGTATVDRVCEPCKVLICPDGWVVAVNEDNLVIFQLPVLTNPVRVEDFHVRVPAGCAFLGDPLDALPWRKLVLAHACGPAGPDVPGGTAATAANLDADNRDTLLRLVPERAGAVDTGRVLETGDAALAAPLLHPVPEHCFYFGLVRSCPCVPDIRIHRFYHVL